MNTTDRLLVLLIQLVIKTHRYTDLKGIEQALDVIIKDDVNLKTDYELEQKEKTEADRF